MKWEWHQRDQTTAFQKTKKNPNNKKEPYWRQCINSADSEGAKTGIHDRKICLLDTDIIEDKFPNRDL